MNHSENLKFSKIIGELIVFLLNRGYQAFHFSIKQEVELETIIIRLPSLEPRDEEELVLKMGRHRETEIETYGWSLLGDSGLEIAGLLIDSIEVEKTDVDVIIHLKRWKKPL
jgi:hypothetical protein